MGKWDEIGHIVKKYTDERNYKGTVMSWASDSILQEMNRIRDEDPGASALEVGAGPNPAIHMFAKRTYVDLHPDLLRFKELDGDKIVADIRKLDIPRHDVIVLNDSFNHVPPGEQEALLERIADAANKHVWIADLLDDGLPGHGVKEDKLREVMQRKGFKCKSFYRDQPGFQFGKDEEAPTYFFFKATREKSRREPARRLPV